MEYQNYENYMRGILGYKTDYNNVYNNSFSNFGDDRFYQDYYNNLNTNINSNINTNELDNMYPEIYKMTYPMICKLCMQNQNRRIDQELLNSMANEIYDIVEPENDRSSSQAKQQAPLRNGDVRNPNAKESDEKREPKKRNFLLLDLIKILILREFINMHNRPGGMHQQPHQPRPRCPYCNNQEYNFGRPF